MGEKGGWHMKKRIKYTNEPISLKAVDDFLPSPEKLVLREENVKITIALSKASVEFFKKHAKKTHNHYQTMIKRILDYYVAHYQ